MIKLVYCITKKPGLTDQQFFEYWKKGQLALTFLDCAN